MAADKTNNESSQTPEISEQESETNGVVFEVVEKELHEGKKVPRRGVYLLPNLFTTGALFSAFYAIIYAMNGHFEQAAIAIFVSMIFDGLDGRVARLTNTQSAFGAQYDSLADCISFGVAPALVSYAWALSELGKFGWMIGFIYLACAALRLARFNVQLDSADKRYFTGLPSPSAAAVVAGMVWFGVDQGATGAEVSWGAALLTGFAAVMMVSNIKYSSFKELDFKGRVPFVAIPVVILAVAVITVYPSGLLLGIFLLYALSGPALHYRRKAI